jgi:hypothetical protein
VSLERGSVSLLSITEELIEDIIEALVEKIEITAIEDPSR